MEQCLRWVTVRLGFNGRADGAVLTNPGEMLTALTNDQRLLDIVIESRRRSQQSGLSGDSYFNVFAAAQALRERGLSMDQLLDGIVDGTNDCGIDGFWIFVDGRYVTADVPSHMIANRPVVELEVLQAKTSTGFGESALEKLSFHLPGLLDESAPALPDHTVNEKLRERSRRFQRVLNDLAIKFPSVHVRVNYATRAAAMPGPAVKAKATLLKGKLDATMAGLRSEIRFLDAAALRELDAASENFTLQLKVHGTPISTDQGNGFVSLVNVLDYFEFLRSPSGALRLELFDSNVRDFAGTTVVNEAISDTLKDVQTDDFWCFNNGVTIIADQASFMSGKLSLLNPQIVNGLQTSSVLFEHFSMQRAADPRNVLVRVVVPAHTGTRDKIIRATNSQTELPAGALRATEKMQIDLEEWLSRGGYFYERRANYYKNLNEANDRIVSVVELARQFMGSAIGRPHEALTRAESLLDDDAIYGRIFNDSFSADAYINVLDLYRATDAYLREQQSRKKLPGGSIEPWRFHFAFLVTGFLTRTPDPTPKLTERLQASDLTEPRARRLLALLQDTYESAISARVGTGLQEVAETEELTRRIRGALQTTLRRGSIQ